MPVSRKAFIHGANNIEIKGKTIIHEGCHIRGDFGHIRIGRYCRFGQGTIVRPPSYQNPSSLSTVENKKEGAIQFLPQSIGSHTRIGTNCIIEAAAVGSSVYIGNNCVISKRVIIKDCSYIADGTVIPPDTVIPPFSRVSGCPGRIRDEMPESIAAIFPEDCMSQFSEFCNTIKV
jgi:dynactin 5